MSENIRMIGPYHLQSILKNTEIASIHEGYHEQLPDHPLWILQVLPHLTADDDIAQQIVKTARQLQRLQHPHLLTPQGIYHQDGELLVIYPAYPEGQPVQDLLDTLSTHQRTWLFSAMIDVMSVFHQAGLRATPDFEQIWLHPDALDFRWFPVLSFEIPRTLQQTQAGVLKGTLTALSPEETRGLPIDESSDYFKLGRLLVEAETGFSLYKAESDFQTLDSIAQGGIPEAARGQVSAGTKALAEALLQSDPAKRLTDPATIKAQLQQLSTEFPNEKEMPVAAGPPDLDGPESVLDSLLGDASDPLAPPAPAAPPSIDDLLSSPEAPDLPLTKEEVPTQAKKKGEGVPRRRERLSRVSRSKLVQDTPLADESNSREEAPIARSTSTPQAPPSPQTPSAPGGAQPQTQSPQTPSKPKPKPAKSAAAPPAPSASPPRDIPPSPPQSSFSFNVEKDTDAFGGSSQGYGAVQPQYSAAAPTPSAGISTGSYAPIPRETTEAPAKISASSRGGGGEILSEEEFKVSAEFSDDDDFDRAFAVESSFQASPSLDEAPIASDDGDDFDEAVTIESNFQPYLELEEAPITTEDDFRPSAPLALERRPLARKSSGLIGGLGDAAEGAAEVLGAVADKVRARKPKKQKQLLDREEEPPTPSLEESQQAIKAGERLAKVLRRKGVVRNYIQMNPGKIFPLLVSIVKAEMYIKIPDIANVQQVESEQVMEIKESSPKVTIVPVLPGCIVSPAQAVVDVRADKVDTEFWVAPLSEGDLERSARIQIWHDGELKDEIPIPCRVRTQTLTKVTSAFSVMSSASGAFLEAYGKQLTELTGGKDAGLGASIARQLVGLLSSSGMWMGLFFLISAFLCYLWLRPKKGDEIEHFLTTNPH